MVLSPANRGREREVDQHGFPWSVPDSAACARRGHGTHTLADAQSHSCAYAHGDASASARAGPYFPARIRANAYVHACPTANTYVYVRAAANPYVRPRTKANTHARSHTDTRAYTYTGAFSHAYAAAGALLVGPVMTRPCVATKKS